jgi:hypothetical protein
LRREICLTSECCLRTWLFADLVVCEPGCLRTWLFSNLTGCS